MKIIFPPVKFCLGSLTPSSILSSLNGFINQNSMYSMFDLSKSTSLRMAVVMPAQFFLVPPLSSNSRPSATILRSYRPRARPDKTPNQKMGSLKIPHLQIPTGENSLLTYRAGIVVAINNFNAGVIGLYTISTLPVPRLSMVYQANLCPSIANR